MGTHEPDWKYNGLFCGIVPIRLTDYRDEPPAIEARYKLDLLLDIVEGLFGLFIMVSSAIDPDFVPMYPIKITGEIE